MGTSSNGKVVALGDHPRARARLSPHESAKVLGGCRDIALERMAGALSGMLDRVEDELFELAEKSPDRASQDLYLDARARAREKRRDIESAFRSHFADFFNRKLRGEKTPAVARPASGELSLVADDELEESIAVGEMSRKLKAACEGELYALSQRFGFLMEMPDLEDEANPISPATVCAALKDACDQIEADFRVKLALLRQLERHAEDALQRLYHELNAHLVERQILPDIRPVARRNTTPPPKPRDTGAGRAPQVPAEEMFATLAQLVAASSRGAGSEGVAPSAPQPSSALLSELTRMHQEAPGPLLGARDALVNVVRAVKSEGAAAVSGVDSVTLDIVAMLFDYVFEDDHIPASVKALLARLQIPTLKVALLDRGFFSSRAHPARRLLDLLAESSIGLDEEDDRGKAVLAMIEGVVGEVLDRFETDLALFDTLVARVEGFLSAQERVEADLVERSAQLIEAREREEVALMAAEVAVSRRLGAAAWVPPVVRAMLLDTWVAAMARVHMGEGEGSPAWERLDRAMEDLLWSVAPKSAPEDRKRLVAMLPGMLKQVQEGLALARLPQDDRELFLGALVDCHAAAVKAGLRGMAATPAPEPVVPAADTQPRLERELVRAGDVEVEEIRLRTPREAAVRNVFTRTGIWTNVQRGTWVEFDRKSGAAVRARLTWISPNKGVYLFTNPMRSRVAISISPEALAEQMRLGEARLLDEAPLVERAVGAMLGSLRGARA